MSPEEQGRLAGVLLGTAENALAALCQALPPAARGSLAVLLKLARRLSRQNKFLAGDLGAVTEAADCLRDLNERLLGRLQERTPRPRNRERDQEWLRQREEEGLTFGQ